MVWTRIHITDTFYTVFRVYRSEIQTLMDFCCCSTLAYIELSAKVKDTG